MKPCSRSYQDAGGQHELVILAKRQQIAVRLYLQPQRAASPGSSVPLWWGSVLPAPAPAACLGVVQMRTLHHTADPTRLRHAAAPQKPASLAEALIHEPREVYEPAGQLPRTWSQPRYSHHELRRFCHTGNAE
jgi:hypothetical protein